MPKNFKANFEQIIISEISGKEKRTLGNIGYKYPGRLRFEVKGKAPSLFVSNKKKSWYYTPPWSEGEQGNLIVQSSERLFLSKFFDSLSRGLKNNDLYGVKFTKNTITISFKKKFARAIGIKQARFINIKKPKSITSLAQLKNMQLVRADDKKVTLIFSNFDKAAKFSSSYFNFRPPKNTKIMEY